LSQAISSEDPAPDRIEIEIELEPSERIPAAVAAAGGTAFS
jgi:hypothetical protein